MPDIRLQDYVANIKELIRSVRLDEAIAHCQHILRHYPKYIETYALLGEACLEKEMYREAIEFFQRTLGADPENLIARVGLGVIYDEQGAFPEAIWQLERAFELVPGNAEVRRELLRLYGQYDEIDKTRLKLTRGALGRLYSRNGLYERAIGEFHAVLRQDPELPDIRVALVEALWREGRQLEAVEMCMELLDALPNCLKANLILGDIWLRGSNEESAEQRLSVVRALDPENRVAQELMGKDSPLPPEEVFIPELDAIPDDFDFALSGVPGAGAIVTAEAVEMVAAGASDEEEQEPWRTDEELPDWLRDVGVTAEEEPALELVPDDVVLDSPPDESIPAEDMPEWLQEVMGEEGIPPAGATVAVEGETFEDEFVADEESPEPLQEIESPELADAAAAATRVGLAGGAVIAAGLAAGMMDEEDQESTGHEISAEEMPEWLEELVGEEASPGGEEPVSEVVEFAAPPVAEVEVEAPSLEEEALSVDEALPDGEVPDWLGELDTAAVAGVASLTVAADGEEPLLDDEASPDGEVPDWLRDLDSAEVEEIAALPVVEVEDESPALEGEALPADEASPDGEIPDWLRDLGAAGAVGVVGAAGVAALRDDEIETEEIAALPVDEVEDEALPAEEIPDWLLDLDAADVEKIAEPLAAEVEGEESSALPVDEVEEETLPDDEASPDDESPDWLRGLGAAGAAGVVGAAGVAALRDDEIETEEIAALPVDEVEDEALPAEEIPDWLLDLDAADVEKIAEPLVAEVEGEEIAALPVDEVEEETLPDDEASPDGESPDWLRDLGAAGAAGVVGVAGVAALRDDEIETEEIAALPVAGIEGEALPDDEASPDDEIPDWLRDLDSAEVEEIAAPLVAEVEDAPSVTEEVPLIDEIPDWLRDLDADEGEEVAEPPVAEVGAEAVQEGAVPASLLALVAAGLLDESDLESAMAEMSDEELDAQRAEEVPEWLSELVEEDGPAVAEAEPAPGAPVLQEIVIPVTEMPADEEPLVAEPEAEVFIEEAAPEVVEPEAEVLVEEAVLEVAEPEAELFVEEAVPEVVELEAELLVEEAVLEAAEPEAEVFIEEAALEVAGPEAVAFVEEAVLEVAEPEAEVFIEEAVPEVVELEAEVHVEEAVLEVAEPEAEVFVEEAVLEVAEPEAEVFVEEAVLEVAEPEAEVFVEEATLEVAEPEAELFVEEAVLEVAEPEAEVHVEEVAPEAVEPEAEVLIEETVLEVAEEELAAPARADELLQQLKTRPRDYGSRLELARLYYDEQDWDAALANYEKLISARRFLPDIVDDLESLAEQDVEPARVYHMLGDAYMQQDQLDEALEMYRLARQKLTNR